MSEATKTKTKGAESLNIYQRLNLCQKDVSYLQKHYNDKARHFAVSHDVVTQHCREAFIKHGVFVRFDTAEREQRELTRRYKNGEVTNTYTAVCVRATFVNIDNPEDCFSATFWGDGEQADNKSPGAAYSFAVKTALLKTLLIPTGEDEESQHVPERKNVVDAVVCSTPEERDAFRDALKDLAEGKGWDYTAVHAYAIACYEPPLENWSVDQLRAAYNTAAKRYQPQATTATEATEEEPNHE